MPGLLSPDEERALVAWLAAADGWKAITFRGQTARRQAMSFGARYLTQGRNLIPAPPLPRELAALRDRMVDAACARLGRELTLGGRRPSDFALCTALRYPPGGAIGWHADNPAFGPTVLSLSLGTEARLQLRRTPVAKTANPRDRRNPCHAPQPFELTLAPGSLFVLAGDARSSWQHRIRPVHEERYSLTFRAAAQRT